MDDNAELGSYINGVEVLETTNDKKISESNIENNKSSVELLLAVKTGRDILYFSLIIIVTIAAGIATITLIKKKIVKPIYK